MNNINIPKITDENMFENFILDLWKKKLDNSNIQLNGRRGQEQKGVDIFGRNKAYEWVGIQCKVRSRNRLTENEVENEIKEALEFNPRLSEYYIVTTANRDQKLQRYVRTKDEEHLRNGLFRVYVKFWEDIEADLANEKFKDVYIKYYRDQCIKVEYFGNAIGKLISLEMGLKKETPDTRYEILLGKMPNSQEGEGHFGISYWKNCYFILNLNNMKSATFNLPCYGSDIEHAFVTKRDSKIAAMWLNSISNLDELIYGDDYDFTASIKRQNI